MYAAQQTVMRDTEEFRNSCEGKYTLETRGEGPQPISWRSTIELRTTAGIGVFRRRVAL